MILGAISLFSYGSILNTPVGKPIRRTLFQLDDLGDSIASDDDWLTDEDVNELEYSLTAILSEDDGFENGTNDNIVMFERTMLEPIEEEDLPESSMPISPCKPSPHRRQPLSLLNNIEDNSNTDRIEFVKRKLNLVATNHWSLKNENAEDETIIPIPKMRRTNSESIPTPISIISSSPKTLVPEDEENNFQTPCDLTGGIPWFISARDAIRRISPSTMVDLLDGKYSHRYDRLIIVDARYPYEFLGGHIPTAINIPSHEAAERYLFSPDLLQSRERIVLIFHCEFSSERAPKMALTLRGLDRAINAEYYPRLTYPDMYILDGGYKNYFFQFRERCEPPGQYLPMRTQRFRDDLRFHLRMKSAVPGVGFTGNKYNRTKIRTIANGVGLRRSSSSASALSPLGDSLPDHVEAYMSAKLAPGEEMPDEFPSSDGPDIAHGPSSFAVNCFV